MFPAGQSDLELWRALLCLALVDPALIHCPIDLCAPMIFSTRLLLARELGAELDGSFPTCRPNFRVSQWLPLRRFP